MENTHSFGNFMLQVDQSATHAMRDLRRARLVEVRRQDKSLARDVRSNYREYSRFQAESLGQKQLNEGLQEKISILRSLEATRQGILRDLYAGFEDGRTFSDGAVRRFDEDTERLRKFNVEQGNRFVVAIDSLNDEKKRRAEKRELALGRLCLAVEASNARSNALLKVFRQQDPVQFGLERFCAVIKEANRSKAGSSDPVESHSADGGHTSVKTTKYIARSYTQNGVSSRYSGSESIGVRARIPPAPVPNPVKEHMREITERRAKIVALNEGESRKATSRIERMKVGLKRRALRAVELRASSAATANERTNEIPLLPGPTGKENTVTGSQVSQGRSQVPVSFNDAVSTKELIHGPVVHEPIEASRKDRPATQKELAEVTNFDVTLTDVERMCERLRRFGEARTKRSATRM